MSHSNRTRTLDEATRQLRDAGTPDRLSDPARSAILAGALSPDPSREPLLKPLFVPGRQIWAYGALSLALGAFLLTQLDVPDARQEAPRLDVTKRHGDVVIAIHNGDEDHVVYRSESPRDFAQATRHRVQGGVYTEDLSEDGDLVFYRIE